MKDDISRFDLRRDNEARQNSQALNTALHSLRTKYKPKTNRKKGNSEK